MTEGGGGGEIKERVRQVVRTGEVLVRDKWAEFRMNSIYFQVRVGLVAAYVVIVLMTLIVAPPAPPTYRLIENSLAWGVGKRTYLDVENIELGNLKDVIVEVHGTATEFDGKVASGPWTIKVPRLSEGDSVRIWPEKLMTAQNRPAGDNLDISRVKIFEADDPDDVIIDDAPTSAKPEN